MNEGTKRPLADMENPSPRPLSFFCAAHSSASFAQKATALGAICPPRRGGGHLFYYGSLLQFRGGFFARPLWPRRCTTQCRVRVSRMRGKKASEIKSDRFFIAISFIVLLEPGVLLRNYCCMIASAFSLFLSQSGLSPSVNEGGNGCVCECVCWVVSSSHFFIHLLVTKT